MKYIIPWYIQKQTFYTIFGFLPRTLKTIQKTLKAPFFTFNAVAKQGFKQFLQESAPTPKHPLKK